MLAVDAVRTRNLDVNAFLSSFLVEQIFVHVDPWTVSLKMNEIRKTCGWHGSYVNKGFFIEMRKNTSYETISYIKDSSMVEKVPKEIYPRARNYCTPGTPKIQV